MILSDKAIQQAIADKRIEIEPVPDLTSYTSSAVDLTLGSRFQSWNAKVLSVQGTKVELNLAVQSYQKTAKAYLEDLSTDEDGSYVFPRFAQKPMVLLAQTRERVHLKA